MSGGNNNLGARLVVIFLALGIVMLGLSPINKRYGGFRGLLRQVTPTNLSLPDMKSIRASIESLGRSRKRAGEATEGNVVKVQPEPVRSVRTKSDAKSEEGVLTGLLNFFGGSDNRKGQKAEDSEARELARSEAESDDSRPPSERTARGQLAAKSAPQKPKQLDKLSTKDREELNDLLDGF